MTVFSSPWRHPDRRESNRNELIFAIDLFAAGVVVQLLLDRWIAALSNEFRDLPLFFLLTFVPDRVQSSLLFIAGMTLLIAYRARSGDLRRADRGMFVLGCGAVSGGLADVLKIVFGRLRPEALLNDGAYGFHILGGGEGFDSFPSSHSAIAAGIAGSLSTIWPTHRRMIFSVAAAVSASRVVIGNHYLSDALFGFAVGLVVVVAIQMLLVRCGIEYQHRNSSEQ